MDKPAVPVREHGVGANSKPMAAKVRYNKAIELLEQGFRIIITSPLKTTPGLDEGRRISAR